MIYVIIALGSFILGAVAMSVFGAKVSADAIEELHAVEARWAHLIAKLKTSATTDAQKAAAGITKTIDKV